MNTYILLDHYLNLANVVGVKRGLMSYDIAASISACGRGDRRGGHGYWSPEPARRVNCSLPAHT